MSDADDPTRPGRFARLATAARADHGILATLRGRIPTVIGMILLPLLIASSLLWGTGGSTGRLHRAEAAIVNLDQGTVVDEKPISLGQDYARHLKDQQSSNFTWRYGVSVEEAERGLASGQYSAAVIIPSGFSRVLTGTTAKGSTEKATLVVEKSPVAGVSDQVVFGQLSTAATQSLSSSVTKKHLDDLFVTSTQVGSVLGQTSTAAQQAALAAGQLDKQAKSAQQASKNLDKQVTAASGTAQQASDAAAKTASGVSKAGTTGSPAAAGASVDPDAAKAQAAQAAKQAAELAKTSAAAKTSADQATRRAASAGGDGVALQGITGTIAEAAAANKEAAGAYTGKVGQAVRQQAELQSQLAQLQGALTSYVSNVQVVTNAVQQASGVAAGPAGTSQPVVGAQDSSGGNGPNRPRSAMLGPVRAENLPQAPNDDATTERDAVAKALREAARTLAASTTELSAARQDAKKTVAAAKAVQASHDALIKNLPTKQIELSRGLGSAPAACARLDKSQIRACKAGYEAGYNDAVQEVRAALALSRLGSRTDAMLTQSQATLDGLEALQSTGAETAATLTLLAGRVADLTVVITITPETPTASPSPPQSCPEPTPTVTVTATPEPTAAPTATVTVTAPPEPGATPTAAPTATVTVTAPPEPGATTTPAPPNCTLPSTLPSEPQPGTPSPTDSLPAPTSTESPAPTGTESPEPPSPSDEASQTPVDSQSPSPSESSSPVDTAEPSQSPVASQAPAPSQGQSPTSSVGPVPSENPGENPSQQPSPGAGPSQGPSQPSAGVAQLRTREVTTAVSELNATSAAVQKQLATLGKSLQSGQDSLETVAAGSDAQRALTDGASSISQATTAQASVVRQLTSSLTALNQQMAGLSKSVQGLESGAQNLSQENSRISDNATRTAARLDALNQTVAGLQQNTAQVASDASTTAQRTAELQRQITALQQSSGIVETRVGAVADSTGAQTKQVGKVANQVSDVQAQVPSYDETQRQKLADVVTQPIETSQSSAFRNVGWISMLMLLSLWIGAMGLHSTLNGISDQARRSTAPSRRLLLGELGPAAVVAVLQALAVSMVGQAVLQMSPLRWAGVTGTLVLASLSFAAINHALVAYLRAFGRLIAATCAAVTGVTVLTQTYPTGMGLALNLSPVTPAVNAVRGLMTGVSTPGSFAGLLVWLAAGVLFSSLAILRARDPEPIRVPTIHDEV